MMIFVSYSHTDKRWFDRNSDHGLIPWLELALRRDGVKIWYDRGDESGLQAGDEFRREIERQIDSSHISLLMLSEAFFSSDFIQKIELPRIMARVERKEMVVIPVYLEPCQWQDFEYVASRQMVPGGPTPLVDYTDTYAHWTKARDEILQSIRRRIAQWTRESQPAMLPPPSTELPPPQAAWWRRWPLWAGLAFILLLALILSQLWPDGRRAAPPPMTQAPASDATQMPTSQPSQPATAQVKALASLPPMSASGSTTVPAFTPTLKAATPAKSPAVSSLPTTPRVAPTATSRPLTPTATALLAVGTTMISEKDGMELVYVPAGEFPMGAADGDPDASGDEKPQHKVYLDAFWIDTTEVTVAQYRACEVDRACGSPGFEQRGDSHPVTYVTWDDARSYCTWAGRRLPTEAEWEKAARGTDGRTYPWGNEFACNKGNFDDETSWDLYVVPGGAGCDGYDRTAPVGSYPAGASPYGVLDMAGNVLEWVMDWYQSDYYVSSPPRNPSGPETGVYRVLRGDSFLGIPAYVRASWRGKQSPDYRYDGFGFRCATTPEAKMDDTVLVPNKLVNEFFVPSYYLYAMAAVSDTIWLVQNENQDRLYQMDRSGTVLNTVPISISGFVRELAWDGQALQLALDDDVPPKTRQTVRLDLAGRILGVTEDPIDWGVFRIYNPIDGTTWELRDAGHYLIQYDADGDLLQTRSLSCISGNIGRFKWARDGFWVTSNLGDWCRIGFDGRKLAAGKLDYLAGDIALDGEGFLWALASSSRKLYQFSTRREAIPPMPTPGPASTLSPSQALPLPRPQFKRGTMADRAMMHITNGFQAAMSLELRSRDHAYDQSVVVKPDQTWSTEVPEGVLEIFVTANQPQPIAFSGQELLLAGYEYTWVLSRPE